MTQKKQIIRLASSIRQLRGTYHPQTKVWIIPPKPEAAADVMKWAEELGLNLKATAQKVESFQSVAEFREWIKTL
ncbi:MAG: hypothetical protein WCH99_04130 [Verrucomicrobiota bacterium]